MQKCGQLHASIAVALMAQSAGAVCPAEMVRMARVVIAMNCRIRISFCWHVLRQAFSCLSVFLKAATHGSRVVLRFKMFLFEVLILALGSLAGECCA